MKQYVVTDKAGRFVAGQRNPGVGVKLSLTEKQAEAGLREGALRLVKDQGAAADAKKADDPKPAQKSQDKKDD